MFIISDCFDLSRLKLPHKIIPFKGKIIQGNETCFEQAGGELLTVKDTVQRQFKYYYSLNA